MIVAFRLFAVLFVTSMLGQQPAFADQSASGAQISPAASAQPISRSGGEPPVNAPPPAARSGFDYGLQIGGGFPNGDPHYNLTALRGTIEGELDYHFDPFTQLQATFYQVPSVLIGINGSEPLYIKGVPKPIASIALPETNPSAVYKTGALTFSRVFDIDKHPFIITPGYLFSYFEYDDALTVNDDGVRVPIKARTMQSKFVSLSSPIVRSRKWLVTATASSQWLVRLNGLNQTNHPQLLATAYAEYFANKHTSFFFQPSKAVTYDESDPYPEHDFVYIYGLNYRIAKPFFVQALVETFNPTNYAGVGVTSLACYSPPACRSAAPTIGGYKFSSIVISVGIGKPIIPPI